MRDTSTYSEVGWLLIAMPVLVAVLVAAIAVWQWRARVEAEQTARREVERRRRWAVSDRRLSRLHVIESDPGRVERLYPKENP